MFDFFISHSSKFKEIARLVFYLAHSNNVSPWFDESQLPIGVELKPALIDAIEKSNGYLLFHSKYVYESEYIALEMKRAKELKIERGDRFKIIVVKIDEEEIKDEFWKKYKYVNWDHRNQQFSLIEIIECFTGNQSLVNLTASSLLNLYPSDIFSSTDGTISEHTRNYLLTQTSNIKYFLSALASTAREEELRDSILKLLNLNLFTQLPNIAPGINMIGNGVWECLHATRMRITPRLGISGLPSEYSLKIIHNDEVYTKFCFEKNGVVADYAIPFIFGMGFDAELDARPRIN